MQTVKNIKTGSEYSQYIYYICHCTATAAYDLKKKREREIYTNEPKTNYTALKNIRQIDVSQAIPLENISNLFA